MEKWEGGSKIRSHKFDHTWTANIICPCDWLPCRHVALPLHWLAVPTPLFDNMAAACLLHLPVVEGLIFCISVTPHLGTSFPLFHGMKQQLRVSDETEHQNQNTDPRPSFYLTFSFIRGEHLRGECELGQRAQCTKCTRARIRVNKCK